MAAGFTAATNIAELIPEITLEVQYVYQVASLGRQLVMVEDVDGTPGITVEFPRFTEVVGSTGVAETGTPTSHQIDLTMPTATLERRSIYVPISGLSQKGAGSRIVEQIGKAMALAKAKQDDAAIFGIVTGTTNWTTGTGATNAALSISHALAGLLLLEKNEVNETINCVVHPQQYNGIRTALTPVANDDGISNDVSNEVVRNALASRAFGMNWYVTPRIGTGTVNSTSGVYNGLIFVKSGIGYAHAWSPGSTGVEAQRQAKTDTWDMIINYYDSSIVAHGPGVCKLYST